MRIVHLLEWPRRGVALRSSASAAAAVASAAVARRPDVEHLVVALGPSAARRWIADAGLPEPIVQIAPPTGQAALAGPALGRVLRAAGPIDVIQAWSPAAGAVARRIGPSRARICVAALTSAPAARRWRSGAGRGTVVTPCATPGGGGVGAAGGDCDGLRFVATDGVVETMIPRPMSSTWRSSPSCALRREERAVARARLGLVDGERALLLVGDGADAARFVVACALTAASGRRLCAVIGSGAGQARRALRTYAGSAALLDLRVSDAPWTQLACAADVGMIVEEGDIASTTALSVAMGLGLPVIASCSVYERLGVRRQDAPELASAAGTRAELARLAGPLLDDPALGAAALERAVAAGDAAMEGAAAPDFFAALDGVWAAREAHTIVA